MRSGRRIYIDAIGPGWQVSLETSPLVWSAETVKSKQKSPPPDDSTPSTSDIVHLVRLALTGRSQDVQLYVKRLAKKVRNEQPTLADELVRLLREAPTRSSPPGRGMLGMWCECVSLAFL